MKIFSELDVNNDGDVTEEEFVTGCLADEELVAALSDKETTLKALGIVILLFCSFHGLISPKAAAASSG